MRAVDLERFDDWIRGPFCELNTELEELYIAGGVVGEVGEAQRARLCEEGRPHVERLSTLPLPDDEHFDVLGNLGFYLAACARHGVEGEATGLVLSIGSRLGVAPRLLSSHLMTHNTARDGRYKTFTRLRDEILFLDLNTTSVLAYDRASRAVLRVGSLGVSHPAVAGLLRTAKQALEEVIAAGRLLLEELNEDRFFENVRAYYKPHRVGSAVYRGPNAGDFAAISVLDVTLGLCRPADPSYSQIVFEKMPYLAPEDQLLLRAGLGKRSLMDAFLDETRTAGESSFKRNLALFLEVCALHGQATSEHYEKLIEKFIKRPTARMPRGTSHDDLTASGPPLPVVLASLEKLRDRRCARLRHDVPTRYHDVQRLTSLL